MEWLVGVLLLWNKNSLWSVLLLSLVSVTITLSWILSGYTYLGMMLTLVYGGAIVILIVYVLYILDMNKLDMLSSSKKDCLLLSSLLLSWIVLESIDIYSTVTWVISSDIECLGWLNMSEIGSVLLLCSILLLLSLWGTIYLLM